MFFGLFRLEAFNLFVDLLPVGFVFGIEAKHFLAPMRALPVVFLAFWHFRHFTVDMLHFAVHVLTFQPKGSAQVVGHVFEAGVLVGADVFFGEEDFGGVFLFRD